MRTSAEPDLAVRRSRKGMGRGLFALSAIQAGDFVIEYQGPRIPTLYADTIATRYLFEIDNEWTIDGSSRGNLARYVNHSCFPNCEARISHARVCFYALRDIFENEELTIDYGDEYFNEFIRPMGCKCDSCHTYLHAA